MSIAKYGSKVKVHYTGRLEDGSLFDSSVGGDPLEFTIGNGEVIVGFEEAIVGMNVGETREAKIMSDNAYGPYYEDKIMIVKKKELPEDLEPRVGKRLKARQPDDSVVNLLVKDVKEKTVTLDANHPLAGKNLIFKIDLIEVESLIN